MGSRVISQTMLFLGGYVGEKERRIENIDGHRTDQLLFDTHNFFILKLFFPVKDDPPDEFCMVLEKVFQMLMYTSFIKRPNRLGWKLQAF